MESYSELAAVAADIAVFVDDGHEGQVVTLATVVIVGVVGRGDLYSTWSVGGGNM